MMNFYRLIGILCVAFFLAACHSPTAMSAFEAASGKPLTVETPTASPSPASGYNMAQTVTLASATSGAVLRYTLDGSNPANGTVYSSPFVISTQNAVLRVLGTKDGFPTSCEFSGTYNFANGIIFDPNGGSGTMTVESISVGATATLTTNAFTRAGYTFNSWNTKADGGGTSYIGGSSYTMSAVGGSATLYAQWTPNAGNIIFYANDGTSTLLTQTLATGASAPLKANTFTRTGYTFTGWNTNASGTGTAYTDGQTLTMGTSGIALYAQWLGSPSGVSATGGNVQVVLSWTAVTGASVYHIYRSTTSGSQGSLVASPTSNTYTDTAVTNGTTYYYEVAVVKSGFESPGSAQVSALPHPTPVTGVSLSNTSLLLTKGVNVQLTATVSPTDATNQAVTWTSSSSAVTVTSTGLVTTMAVGSATITVTTSDGSHTATCLIFVIPEAADGNLLTNPTWASASPASPWSVDSDWVWTSASGSASDVGALVGTYNWLNATQTVTLASDAAAGKVITFTIYAAGDYILNTNLGMSLTAYDASGNTLATVTNGTSSSSISIASGALWQAYTVSYRVGTTAVHSVQVSAGGNSQKAWAGPYGVWIAGPSLTVQ